MPKPLLTDDIIEQAKRESRDFDRKLQQELENDEALAEKYDKLESQYSRKSTTHKSRRIENAKSKKRGSIINRWLFITTAIVIVLLILFVLYYF